jgi:hypothetical protein
MQKVIELNWNSTTNDINEVDMENYRNYSGEERAPDRESNPMNYEMFT